MTPVGHAAVGYVFAWPRWSRWAFVVGAVAPDMDFLVWWAPQFNAWHRVVTHNLLFAVVFAGLVGLAASRRAVVGGAWRIAVAAWLGVLTHLLVDACMDTSASNGIGVAIAWPFSGVMWSPFNLMTPSNPDGWSEPGAALRATARGIAIEIPFLLAAGVLWWRSRPNTATAIEDAP